MKRLLFIALASFFLAQVPGRAAGIVSRSAAVRPAPLAQLGGLLQAVLPQLPSLEGVRPAFLRSAAMSPGRAETLVLRMKQEGSSPAAREAADQGKGSAVELMSAVNSVLRDFTPGELQKMSMEDLHSLTAVILDQVGRYRGRLVDDGVALLSAKKTELLLAQRGKPAKEVLHNPGHGELHASIISTDEVPGGVRLLGPRPGMVFRYYTTKKDMRAILKTSRLWNGHMPYDQLIQSVEVKDFMQLMGVFLTLPSVRGDRVGRRAAVHDGYVDLLVPRKFPILEVEAGAVYLIAMAPRMRDWLRDMYQRWARGERLSSMDAQEMLRMAKEGGPGPDLSVPIRIVGHGTAKD